MNMRDVSTITKLSYAQIRYFIDQGIVTPEPVRQGQAREFSEDELWILELAYLMRLKRIGIKLIKSISQSIQNTFDRSEPFIAIMSGSEPGEIPAYGAVSVFWSGEFWEVRTGADAINNLLLYATKLLNNGSVSTKPLNYAEIRRVY